MNFVPAKCPLCSGDLQVPENKDFVHCLYCGANIKVRDAVILKSEVNLDNILQLGQISIKNGNYSEGEEYMNKVLEVDIDNSAAWWGKSVAQMNSSCGICSIMVTGIGYAKKAYELGNDEDKQKIYSELNIKLTKSGINYNHIDALFFFFEEFGKSNTAILEKIITVCNEYLYSGSNFKNDADYYINKRDKAFDYLKQLNPALYNTLYKESQKDRDGLNKRIEAIENNAINSIFYEYSNKPGIWVTLIIVSFLLSAIIASGGKKMNEGIFFFFFFFISAILILIAVAVLKAHARDKYYNKFR